MHRREGRECLCAPNPKAIIDPQDYLALVPRQWDDALARLMAFVERRPARRLSPRVDSAHARSSYPVHPSPSKEHR
ncbi:MAG: hypothetical protein L0H23_10085, partial [Luteimonas sp.]|nr:hypothetical protein [Luteimonas sp.]